MRVSVLGYIQRGGIPSAFDRLLATAVGKAAVDLLATGQSSQMVAWQNGQVVAVPLDAVLADSPCLVNPEVSWCKQRDRLVLTRAWKNPLQHDYSG